MEQYVTFNFGISLIFVLATVFCHQYRDDYEYDVKTNAYYKLHTEKRVQAHRARQVCITEAANLMTLDLDEDLVKLHTMLKSFPDAGDLVWVDGKWHDTAEDITQIQFALVPENLDLANLTYCDVVTREGLIETSPCLHKHPFICKVEAKDAPYDPQCGVYASDYKYLSSVGSCYKVSPSYYEWDAAYAECQAEGAHLMVLNSDAEHLAIKKLLRPIASGFTSFYVGIRTYQPTDGSARVFRTIFNETLENASYNGWAAGEPNNYRNSQSCVAVNRNTGKYSDMDCNQWYSFICEKEKK